MTIDYLLLGHVTRDVLPDGSFAPGGTALYSSFTAYRLGQHVAVVSAPADLPPDWPSAIELHTVASETPTFENRYTPQGRVQILHAASQPIAVSSIPEPWRNAPVVHLGPILKETPQSLVFDFPNALLGVTPQGWMRSWPEHLPGPIAFKPWLPEPAVLQRIDALVLSIEDVHGDESLIEAYVRDCPFVVVTRSAAGATLYIRGEAKHIGTIVVEERDPTGAGDVFAAALLIELRRTGDHIRAAEFAACTASLSVQGQGISQVPTREEVEGCMPRHKRQTS